MQNINFIVVDYNNSRCTRSLCESLKSQVGFGIDFNLKCLVVNNSTDLNETTALHEYCENFNWIQVIDCLDNPGYFGGLNRGLTELSTGGNEWVVIGNNDLEFDNDFIYTLLKKQYSPDILALCPDVIAKDGFHQNPHVIRPISAFRRFQFDLYFSHYYVACLLKLVKNMATRKKRKEKVLVEGAIHMGIGACYALTPGFFKYYKNLNYPVFLYGEEAFISDQIHAVGGLVWFDPALKVFHAESATLNKVPRRRVYEFTKQGYPLYRHLL